MKLIGGMHSTKKLEVLAKELIDQKEKAIVLTRYPEYVEDVFFKQTDLLFDIEIMTLKDYMKSLMIAHRVFDRRLLTSIEWTRYLRRALQKEAFHYFHFSNNSYSLIHEIMTTLQEIHANDVSLDQSIDEELLANKCADLRLFMEKIYEYKDPHAYLSLEEATYDLLDENLKDTNIYILGDDYITKREVHYIEQMSQYANVTVLLTCEDQNDLSSIYHKLYHESMTYLPIEDTDYERFIAHDLFTMTPLEVKYPSSMIKGGHPLEECMKVLSDIKGKLMQGAHYHDFAIITNQPDYMQMLKALCDEQKWPCSLSEHASLVYEADYRKIKEALTTTSMQTFDEIVTSLLTLGLKEPFVSYLESLRCSDAIKGEEMKLFIDATLPALSQAMPRHDEILILSLEEAHLAMPHHLYLMGLNEALLPAVFKDQGLLSDDNYLALGNNRPFSSSEALGSHYVHIIQALLNPALSLTFSYSVHDMRGGELMPSTLANRLQDVLKPVSLKPTLNVFTKAFYLSGNRLPDHQINDMIDDYESNGHQSETIAMEQVDKLGKGISISRIETYNKCPFKYFVQYGLKIYPSYKEELQANELGRLSHAILESCLEDPDHIQEVADCYIAKHLDKQIHDSSINQYFVEQLILDLKTTIKMIQWQLDQGQFEIKDKELKIEGSLGGVPFSGIIDRVDAFDDYLRIIDYKSSDKDINLSLAMQGFNIQMLVYLEMLKEATEKKPGAFHYVSLKKKMLSIDAGFQDEIDVKELIKLYKMKGYVIDDDAHAIINASGDEDGVIIPASFKKDGTAKGNAMNEAFYETLMQTISTHISTLYEAIRTGDIRIYPSKADNDEKSVYPCTYCDYRSVCLYDVFYNDYHRIEVKKDKEILAGGESDATVQ